MRAPYVSVTDCCRLLRAARWVRAPHSVGLDWIGAPNALGGALVACTGAREAAWLGRGGGAL